MQSWITKFAAILSAALVFQTAKAEIVGVYKRDGTMVLLTEDSLIATGGNTSHGPDAAADCIVVAERPTSQQRRKVHSIQGEPVADVQIVTRRSAANLEIVDLNVFGRCGLRSDFTGTYRKAPISRTATAGAVFVMSETHDAALDAYKRKGAPTAADLMRPVVGLADFKLAFKPDELASVCAFTNDYAYFLQQSGQSAASISPLLDVIKACPDRTAAYLNLGDSYWAIGNTASASNFYQRYIDLLRKAGRQKVAPVRAVERAKMSKARNAVEK